MHLCSGDQGSTFFQVPWLLNLKFTLATGYNNVIPTNWSSAYFNTDSIRRFDNVDNLTVHSEAETCNVFIQISTANKQRPQHSFPCLPSSEVTGQNISIMTITHQTYWLSELILYAINKNSIMQQQYTALKTYLHSIQWLSQIVSHAAPL